MKSPGERESSLGFYWSNLVVDHRGADGCGRIS